MNNLIRNIFLFFAIGILALTTFSCSCKCGENADIKIPGSVLFKADQFIIDKTTKEFFQKYISIDLQRTQKNTLGYDFVYRLKIPEKPFVDVLIQFSTDTSGKIREDRAVTGIPECKFDPEECSFEVDENKAVQIAKDAGLEKGIKDWRKMFLWSDKYKTYTWIILSTFSESKGTNGYKGNGREIVIKAGSGKIIDNTEWFIR